MMNIKRTVLSLAAAGLISGGLLVSPVAAQEASTESATPTGTEIKIKKNDSESTETATQILQNLERLAKNQDQTEQIEGKYDGITNKTRGFIAQVISLKEDSFRIATPNGEEVFITPDKSTTIVKKGLATTGDDYVLSEWFAIDDWLVLIGVQNGEVFQPRRILVSSEPLAPQKHFVSRGSIKTSSTTKVEVALPGQAAVEAFTINKSTTLVDGNNETITTKDLELGQNVLLIGVEQADGTKQLQTLRQL